tara:strand:- start:1523 stop:1837 length:315 start_codon:yes stop_codon:yes gene_type:complete
MTIQFNTDKTISGSEKNQNYFTAMIAEALTNYEDYITRVEVHLADENGNKEGVHDVRCLLEARIEGKQPIAVSCQDNTVELAVSGAIDKLSASLDNIFGRLQNH